MTIQRGGGGGPPADTRRGGRGRGGLPWRTRNGAPPFSSSGACISSAAARGSPASSTHFISFTIYSFDASLRLFFVYFSSLFRYSTLASRPRFILLPLVSFIASFTSRQLGLRQCPQRYVLSVNLAGPVIRSLLLLLAARRRLLLLLPRGLLRIAQRGASLPCSDSITCAPSRAAASIAGGWACRPGWHHWQRMQATPT